MSQSCWKVFAAVILSCLFFPQLVFAECKISEAKREIIYTSLCGKNVRSCEQTITDGISGAAKIIQTMKICGFHTLAEAAYIANIKYSKTLTLLLSCTQEPINVENILYTQIGKATIENPQTETKCSDELKQFIRDQKPEIDNFIKDTKDTNYNIALLNRIGLTLDDAKNIIEIDLSTINNNRCTISQDKKQKILDMFCGDKSLEQNCINDIFKESIKTASEQLWALKECDENTLYDLYYKTNIKTFKHMDSLSPCLENPIDYMTELENTIHETNEKMKDITCVADIREVVNNNIIPSVKNQIKAVNSIDFEKHFLKPLRVRISSNGDVNDLTEEDTTYTPKPSPYMFLSPLKEKLPEHPATYGP